MKQVFHTFSQEIEKLYFSIVRTIFIFLKTLIGHFSLVGNSNILDNRQFDWVETLEANSCKIGLELDEILKYREQLPNFQDISPEQSAITQAIAEKHIFYTVMVQKPNKID